MLAALLLTFAIVPHEPGIVRDEVGRLEINHVHCDQTGRETFVQLIGWDWNEQWGVWEVVFWRKASTREFWPHHDWARGGYTAAFHDDGNTLRVVRANSFDETWGTYDREVENREVKPESLRRRLSGERRVW